jgi:hypothetical protein
MNESKIKFCQLYRLTQVIKEKNFLNLSISSLVTELEKESTKVPQEYQLMKKHLKCLRGYEKVLNDRIKFYNIRSM